VRDVGLAEELAQDALLAALEQWPESGFPDNPGAWLMATAAPKEPEVHGLVALMEIRRRARAPGPARRESPSRCSSRTEPAGTGR